jgi:arginase
MTFLLTPQEETTKISYLVILDYSYIWEKDSMQNRFIVSPFFLDKAVPGLESLAKSDWVLNQPQLPEGDQQTRMAAIYRPMADLVAETTKDGERPVIIAGDCCTPIPVLAGVQRAGLHPMLLWFDAHGDFNTWETTPNGFLGGMPLAMLVGRGEQTLVNAVGLHPHPEGQVILSDARDLDPGERDALRASEILHVPRTNDLCDYPLLQGPLFIHFDVDVIRTEDVPAVSYPAAGGISAAELREVFQYLAQAAQIVAVSVASWNPEADTDGKSQAVCMELLHALIGS